MVADIITPFKLVLNCGAEDGIAEGDTFEVFALGKPIQDPQTKEILEPLEIVRGRGKVIHLQKKICTLESIEKRIVTKKEIRQTGGPFAVFSAPTIIEKPEIENLPFDEAQIGDLVRKLPVK